MRSSTVLSFLCMTALGIWGCGSSEAPQSASPTAANQSQAAAPQTAPAESAGGVVAAEWDGGGKVYLSDIDNIVRPAQLMAMYNPPEGVSWVDVIAQKRKSSIEMLVDNYLLIAEAKDRGLEMTPAEKEQALNEFKSQFETEEDYQKNLASAGQSEDQIIEVLANIGLGKKCMEDERKRIEDSITEETMKEYYDNHIDMFTPPARSSVNRVVIEQNDKRSLQEAKDLADSLYAQVKEQIASATDFAGKRKVLQQFAYKYSDTPDGSYNYGYCIIYHTQGMETAYGKEFLEEVLKTPVEELSSVVPTLNGYGFFLVKDKTPSTIQPYDSKTVQTMLPQMMKKEKLEQWRNELHEKYHVRILEDNLRLNVPEPDTISGATTTRKASIGEPELSPTLVGVQ